MPKQIKFIKDSHKCKSGNIYEASDKDADDYVKRGYAEFVKKDVPKKAQIKIKF